MLGAVYFANNLYVQMNSPCTIGNSVDIFAVLVIFLFLARDSKSTMFSVFSGDVDVPHCKFHHCIPMQFPSSKQPQIEQYHKSAFSGALLNSSLKVQQKKTVKMSLSEKNLSPTFATQFKLSKTFVGFSNLCFLALPNRCARGAVSTLKLRGAGNTTTPM
jgi:hypothetical protein